MKPISEEEYLGLKALQLRLLRVYLRYKLPGTFEDFFHAYHDDFLKGHAQNQKLKYYAIDYLRKFIGRHGKKTDFNIKISLDEAPEPATEDNFSDFEVHNAISKMKGKFRVIAGLKTIHDLTNKEIGFLFNVGESRISQMLEEIIKRPFKDIPFKEDQFLCSRFSKLQRLEEASRLLGVTPMWLREKMGELDEDL